MKAICLNNSTQIHYLPETSEKPSLGIGLPTQVSLIRVHDDEGWTKIGVILWRQMEGRGGGHWWPRILLEKPSARPIQQEGRHAVLLPPGPLFFGRSFRSLTIFPYGPSPRPLEHTLDQKPAEPEQGPKPSPQASSSLKSGRTRAHSRNREEIYPRRQGIGREGSFKGTQLANKTEPGVAFLHIILPFSQLAPGPGTQLVFNGCSLWTPRTEFPGYGHPSERAGEANPGLLV